MLIAGIVLIILQCLGVASAFIGGRNPFNAHPVELLGYFLVGIIGVILIICHYVRKKKKANANKRTAQKEIAVTADREQELTKVLQDLETEPERYYMNKSLADRYTRMFNEPFDRVINKSEFIINGNKCTMYGFSPLYLNECLKGGYNIGRFGYFIEVQGDKARYFASEWSYNNTFFLCEWEFDGERKTVHLNYGEVVSSIADISNHAENIKKNLKEILT